MAVEDCSYHLLTATEVRARTSPAYCPGCEEPDLPLYALGGTEAVMAAGLPGTVTVKALPDAGPVREPSQPAGREATDGLRRAYEELLAATD